MTRLINDIYVFANLVSENMAEPFEGNGGYSPREEGDAASISLT